MKSLKYILIAVGLIALVAISWYGGMKFMSKNEVKETSVDVVLEKVEKVVKLVTVEGHISEIYKHKDYYNWDIPLFRKKALLRVNGKVSIGYDFNKIDIQISEDNKSITFHNFPAPEIIAIDHDLDYYDIQQGTFNSFSTEDYNEINESAKSYLKTQAIDSELIKSAEEQKDDILDMLKTIIEASGWKLIIENEEILG